MDADVLIRVDDVCRYEEGTIEDVRAVQICTLELPSPESEPAFASVSEKAIGARAEVLCACAAVLLCLCMLSSP